MGKKENDLIIVHNQRSVFDVGSEIMWKQQCLDSQSQWWNSHKIGTADIEFG